MVLTPTMQHVSSSEGEMSTLVETIRTMRKRERDYSTSDYLHQPFLMAYHEPVDVNCRSQMVEWMVNIIDHCKFNRATVAISINILDRFLMNTPGALEDRSAFQLASITSLYTAIKIHEPTVLSVENMAMLSKNVYNVSQIESMERLILETDRWLMNPSTSFIFSHYLCELVACKDSRYDSTALMDLTNLQLEATLQDYELNLVPASSVALAATMNAVDSMGLSPLDVQRDLAEFLMSAAHAEERCVPLDDIRIRLYEGITDCNKGAPIIRAPKSHATCGSPIHAFQSPRSVSNVTLVSP